MRRDLPPKSMSRRERVAMMSEAEKDRLRTFARQLRGERRRDALQVVVEAAQSYAREQGRENPGHGGRQRQRETELCQAIEQAHEAIQEGPLTDDDYMIAMAALEAEDCSGV